ncbi:hypothetical protein [Dermabacter sp. Marseille-Q3180]|uniref:hypothetical protein n=1 Tax=Dermabacter sp. Marseille-Q3180 TaxID=2758090 RepID=UPI002024D7FE|nr:hypothetical protein [Dermabacter sp. Marseille-Q3180]
MSLFRDTIREDWTVLLSLMLPVVLAVAVFAFPVSSTVAQRDLRLGTVGDSAQESLRLTEFFPGDFTADPSQVAALQGLLQKGSIELRIPLGAFSNETAKASQGVVVSGATFDRICAVPDGEKFVAASKLDDASVARMLEPTPFRNPAEIVELSSRARSGTLGYEYIDLDEGVLVCVTPEALDEMIAHVGASTVIDSAKVTRPLADADLDPLTNNYGAVSVSGQGDEWERSHIGFVAALSACVLALFVMVAWVFVRTVRDNVAALNVRNALGYSPAALLRDLIGLAAVIWVVPSMLAFVPAALVGAYPVPLSLVCGVALVPACVLVALTWHGVTSQGVKTAAWVRR